MCEGQSGPYNIQAMAVADLVVCPAKLHCGQGICTVTTLGSVGFTNLAMGEMGTHTRETAERTALPPCPQILLTILHSYPQAMTLSSCG